jgi:hypothetical protein
LRKVSSGRAGVKGRFAVGYPRIRSTEQTLVVVAIFTAEQIPNHFWIEFLRELEKDMEPRRDQIFSIQFIFESKTLSLKGVRSLQLALALGFVGRVPTSSWHSPAAPFLRLVNVKL